jgi:hypothetical protein
MQTARRAHDMAPVVLLLAVAFIAVACSSSISVPIPIATGPLVTGPLVTIETRGGLCAEGPCGTTVILERDGRVHQAAKPPNDLGTVSPVQLAALDSLIRSTDLAAIRSHPFTGQCPTAYDGQEVVLEFGAPGGVQRIASCEVEVDWRQPLFVAVSTTLGPFVSLPTP